jgi:hypothetical protein
LQDLDAEELWSHRRRPAATQPPSTPLGEPDLERPVARARVFPSPDVTETTALRHRSSI